MPVRFIIPGPLRELAGNQDEVRVKDSPETVGDGAEIVILPAVSGG